jgi:hypothetical protein
MILAGLLTVALLLFVLVMVWRCWNLPPVPATRLWALAFGGMSAGMLYQFWRAEAWKSETEKLELNLQGRRLLPRPPTSPKTRFSPCLSECSSRFHILPDAASQPFLLCGVIPFPALATASERGNLPLWEHLDKTLFRIVAAGLEEKPWSLEQVVEMTENYWLKKTQQRSARIL